MSQQNSDSPARKAYDKQIWHLRRHMRMRNWNSDQRSRAELLLSMYLGLEGHPQDIAALESRMAPGALGETRKRYAGAVYLSELGNAAVTDTPGQAQPWFANEYAEAKSFYTARSTSGQGGGPGGRAPRN